MQFSSNYNEINLYNCCLTHPSFNENKNIFESKISNEFIIKSEHMRLINLKDNLIICEFLYNTNNFYQFMMKADTYFKKEIIKKGVEWFNNNLNIDTINNMSKHAISLPERLPNFPTITFFLDHDCQIVNCNNRSMKMDQLKSNMEIVLFLSVECLEFYKNRCNLKYKIHKIQVMNQICQTLENLFSHNNDSSIGTSSEENIMDEINDITASTFR